jgi:uncharacterized protein
MSQQSDQKERTMANLIVWADIPVADLERASKFYSHVLGVPVASMPGMEGVAIPGSQPDADQSSSQMPSVAFDLYVGGTPGEAGPTVYLSSGGDFPGILARVREAGGQVIQEPQDMGSMVGTLAFIKDTEGNRLGIHQPPAGM